MKLLLLSALATLATAQCVLPIPDPLISNNITMPFGIEVQYPANPAIHGRRMNFNPAGGGDQHLYLSPAGNAMNNLTLVNGVLTTQLPGGPIIRAVINGEYTARDNTTKMFVTQRGDPRATYTVEYACNQTDPLQVQTQLKFDARKKGDVGEKGEICVRAASLGRYEFRWSPEGNEAPRLPECFKVTMALVF